MDNWLAGLRKARNKPNIALPGSNIPFVCPHRMLIGKMLLKDRMNKYNAH